MDGVALPGAITDPLTNAAYVSESDSSVAFDRSGDFFVLESEHNVAQTSGALVVQGFTFTGIAPVRTTTNSIVHQWVLDQALNPTLAVDANAGNPTTSLNVSEPVGLTFGPNNNLFVGNQGNGQVQQFNGGTGSYQNVFASSQTLIQPGQLSFDPLTGNLLVADQLSGQVLQYDGKTGTSLGLFTQVPTTASAPTFTTIGPDGYLYVSSFANNEVLRYDPASGLFHGVFVKSGAGGLQGPEGLAFGPDNNLYVVGSGNNQVLRYDGKTGQFLGVFAGNGLGGAGRRRSIRRAGSRSVPTAISTWRASTTTRSCSSARPGR